MRHLLSSADLSSAEVDSVLDVATQMAEVARRPVKKLPRSARPHGRQSVLRGLDPHPVLVRDRRQVALRRRHHHLRQGLIGVEVANRCATPR